MPIDFTATEVGFDDGMGGASNAAGADEYHYILFGKDGDGVYFEFDDQINGLVGQVVSVKLEPARVVFTLKNRRRITVRKQTNDAKWPEFIAGVRATFAPDIVTES